MKQDRIVIIDLGSSGNTMVARAVRSLGVYSEIYPHDITSEQLSAIPGVRGVILNGGENRVVDGSLLISHRNYMISVYPCLRSIIRRHAVQTGLTPCRRMKMVQPRCCADLFLTSAEPKPSGI